MLLSETPSLSSSSSPTKLTFLAGFEKTALPLLLPLPPRLPPAPKRPRLLLLLLMLLLLTVLAAVVVERLGMITPPPTINGRRSSSPPRLLEREAADAARLRMPPLRVDPGDLALRVDPGDLWWLRLPELGGGGLSRPAAFWGQQKRGAVFSVTW